MEDQAIYQAGPPPLAAETIVTLVAQGAALLQAAGFEVLGWDGQPGALPPPAALCQELRATWQGPDARFEATLMGYPTVGLVTVELHGNLRGFRAETGQFLVRDAPGLAALLHGWQPLLHERERATGAVLAPVQAAQHLRALHKTGFIGP